MGNCNYCTNYFVNVSHERGDDCCYGLNDCRKKFYHCDEKLKPGRTKEDDIQDMIKELRRYGYKVTKE